MRWTCQLSLGQLRVFASDLRYAARHCLA